MPVRMTTEHLPFESHPEHAEAINRAIHAIQKLGEAQPGLAEALRAAASTEEASQLLGGHGIEISPEALWRHRGEVLKDGQPTWPG